MSKSDTRSPQEVLQSIGTNATAVRNAATGLSECIEEFQTYLSKLPGRVEAECFGVHPDAESLEQAESMSLVLRFHRDGKGWRLSWGSYYDQYHNDPDHSVEFKPLDTAPVKIKVAAVKMFPNLLVAIELSNEALVKKIEEAKAEYRSFADSLDNRKRLKEGV